MGELRKGKLLTNYGDCHICRSMLSLRCVSCKRYVCDQHGEHMGDGNSAFCRACYRAELRRRDSIGKL